MASLRQPSFSGGELSPLFWGRTDLSKFATGLRRCRNFFISKSGAAVSRAGTVYLGEASVGPIRLVPFVYSDDVSYVLEFGHEYVRFWSDGALVESSPGVPLEVVTPYSSANLNLLQWAQVGDILTLTHPSYEPSELKRVDATTWTLTAVIFTPPPPHFADIDDPNSATLNFAADETTFGVVDSDHPGREWKYAVTVTAQSLVTGELLETLPAFIQSQYDGVDYDGSASALNTLGFCVYPDRAVTFRRATTAGLLGVPPEWRFLGTDFLSAVAFNIYRGRGDLYGFIGTTKTRDFVDVGDAPNYAIQPPRGSNPFKVFDREGALLRTEYPAAVAFFEERRVFAATTERPGWIFASRSGDYFNYDVRLVLNVAGEALAFELAARRRELIRSLLPLDRLLVFTNSSVWSVGGYQTNPLDFSSIDAKVVEEIGAGHLPALVVDGAALYSRVKGVGVRALLPANTRSGYSGVDLSLLAQHLFNGLDSLGESRTIVDWAYAEDPWGVVWVCIGGDLLSLTFDPAQEMWAWAQHTTDGRFLGVCTVPEGDEDAVYVVVLRVLNGDNKYFIERMASRVRRSVPATSTTPEVLDPNDDCCVDAALKYVGPAGFANFAGLEHLEGREVYVCAVGNPVMGPFTVEDGEINTDDLLEANNPNLDDPENLTAYIGLLYQPELETLDAAQDGVRAKQKTVTAVAFEVEQTRGVSVGPDFDNLRPAQRRAVSDSYNATSPVTELVRAAIKGGWNSGARACLRQTQPLPATVLGFTREVEIGD